MAALQTQGLSRAADAALAFVEFLENEIAFVGSPGFLERRESRRTAARAARKKRRNMLALDARLGIHDHDALYQVAQLAHVAGPGVLPQRVHGIFGELLGAPPISVAELLGEVLGQQRDVFQALA